jgi:hypothetical protein
LADENEEISDGIPEAFQNGNPNSFLEIELDVERRFDLIDIGGSCFQIVSEGYPRHPPPCLSPKTTSGTEQTASSICHF